MEEFAAELLQSLNLPLSKECTDKPAAKGKQIGKRNSSATTATAVLAQIPVGGWRPGATPQFGSKPWEVA